VSSCSRSWDGRSSQLPDEITRLSYECMHNRGMYSAVEGGLNRGDKGISARVDFSVLSEFFLELLFRPWSFAGLSLLPTASSQRSSGCPLPPESGSRPFSLSIIVLVSHATERSRNSAEAGSISSVDCVGPGAQAGLPVSKGQILGRDRGQDDQLVLEQKPGEETRRRN
jgi:hypothetical protein